MTTACAAWRIRFVRYDRRTTFPDVADIAVDISHDDRQLAGARCARKTSELHSLEVV
jgi:hypothetical protein